VNCIVVLPITVYFFITSQKLNLSTIQLSGFSLNKVYFVGLDSADFFNKNMVICKALRQIRSKKASFDVLLTVHLSIILVINQLNAQNLVL